MEHASLLFYIPTFPRPSNKWLYYLTYLCFIARLIHLTTRFVYKGRNPGWWYSRGFKEAGGIST
jgi:hypothetical protein